MSESFVDDGPISHDTFAKVASTYWVRAHKRNPSMYELKWRSGSKPPPPFNHSMEWRRPTYEEVVDRQERMDHKALRAAMKLREDQV